MWQENAIFATNYKYTFMKKDFLKYALTVSFVAMAVILLGSGTTNRDKTKNTKQPETKAKQTDSCSLLFQQLNLDDCVSEKAFRQAYTGYQKIQNRQRDVLTLIDFSKPSTQERLFVIDMKKHKLLIKSLCAHGRKSGGVIPTEFSNVSGSHKSSLGFYLTDNTYQGNNGYSLRLNGLEKGINDKAWSRAIVVHGAKYANPNVCASGRLGRSWGCPAVPEKLARPIIDAIKGGSVLYIYANKPSYEKHSIFLQ